MSLSSNKNIASLEKFPLNLPSQNLVISSMHSDIT